MRSRSRLVGRAIADYGNAQSPSSELTPSVAATLTDQDSMDPGLLALPPSP